MNLELWRQGVSENTHALKSVLEDKLALKKAFEDFIKQFFTDYDEIDFSEDLHKVALKWKYGTDPTVRNDNISEIGMDWTITTEFSDKLGQSVVIILYPWAGDS